MFIFFSKWRFIFLVRIQKFMVNLCEWLLSNKKFILFATKKHIIKSVICEFQREIFIQVVLLGYLFRHMAFFVN